MVCDRVSIVRMRWEECVLIVVVAVVAADNIAAA